MAFPEKITYTNKYNLRPIVEQDGQFTAENANELKDKLNKNALFYDVHDNLAALQAAFPNPPKGAFAYLLDGSHYRCVNIGWTTNESAGGSNYFKGYHLTLPALRTAHPTSIPGARAIIKVSGANDQEALWDEDAQDWFAFDIESLQAIVSNHETRITVLENGGEATTNTAINKINAFSAGYTGGLNYSPYMDFNFGSTNFKVTTNLTLDPADATYSRIDLIVGNSNGTITKITGVPAANPVEPAINNDTQLKGAFILIEANATAPSGVSLKKIYDENVGNAGGELDVSITAGAGWNLADLSDPKKGTKAIKGTNLQNSDQLQFTPTIKIPGAEFTELVLYVKNLKVSALSDPFYFYLFGDTASTRGRGTATQFLQNLSKFGYDKNNITDWQFIAIPIAVLGITEIRYLQLVNQEPGFDVLIDGISYNDGSAPTGNEFATTGFVINEVEAAKTEVLAAAKAYTDAQIAASLAWQHRYTTITTLLANQAEQTTTKPQFVFDASIDPTVNTASTWAVYELKDIAVKTGALSDYRKLSEQESMDVAAAPVVDPVQVTKTTTASFNTEALSDLGYSQNGKNTLIKNGVNAINLTAGATANFVGTYMKIGTGAITFLASTGKTIVPVNGTSVIDGAVGSTATVTVDGNNVYVLISNAS